MRIVISVDGARFYDSLEHGLGDYFIDSLLSDIDSLLLYAGIHVKVWGYYRLLSQRFPYAVYYSLEDDLVRIHAVLDCRQDPERIRKRIQPHD
ncbi:MAG: type II toxin-antitoxin system RelE/ParE family toxin [Spirochaetaceae bacterium]|nr:MAG: type II toxin-antitoxin system RelE/ParE family toxin [Spirochaetaceae bacterium]